MIKNSMKEHYFPLEIIKGALLILKAFIKMIVRTDKEVDLNYIMPNLFKNRPTCTESLISPYAFDEYHESDKILGKA